MLGAKRFVRILCCLGVLLCGQMGEAQSPPNGDMIVKKMLQTYRSASTVRDESQATIIDPKLGRYEQRSVTVYQAPNHLYTSTVDPQQGTISTYCDGRLLALYSGKQNIFTRRNAPASLSKTIALSEKAMLDSLRISITQLLNPLSFLAGDGTIREATTFKFMGTESVAGYKTYKVSAQANPALLQGMMPPRSKVQFIKKEITLWIDVRRNLLIKASAQLIFKATFPPEGVSAPRTVQGGLLFEEVHRSTILNAPVKDAEFRFTPPKNAQEIFQERRN